MLCRMIITPQESREQIEVSHQPFVLRLKDQRGASMGKFRDSIIGRSCVNDCRGVSKIFCSK